MKRLRAFLMSWEALLVVLLILAIIMGTSLSPYFLTGFNASSLTRDLMEKAIMALPMTLIIIAGEIDLSVASTLGLASVILGATWSAGVPLWLGMIIVLVIGAIAGALNGLLVTRLGLPSLVVTIGTLALVSNFPSAFTTFGFGSVPGTLIPWPFVVFVILALIFMVVLHWSWIGRQIYAVGNNKEAARFAGIRVADLKLALFVLSGLLAALAGIIFTARFSSARPDNALGFELDVVTIVLLGGVNIFGGRGTLVGVILSLFIIGIVRNALSFASISGDIQNIVVGTLLIFSVLGPNVAQSIQATLTRRRLAAGDVTKKV